MKPSWRVRGKSLQLRYDGGCDINGKRRMIYETVSDFNEKGRRNSDAQRNRLWEEFANRCRKGDISSPSAMTVEDIVLYHVDSKVNLSPTTRRSHHYTIGRHLGSGFGQKKANKVTRADAKKWVKQLTEETKPNGKKYSAKTIQNVVTLVSSAYRTAIKEDILTFNPFDNIELPKAEKKEAEYYDLETAVRFIRLLDTVPDREYNYKVAVLLAMMCGLRRGEICGILENEVFQNENVLKVRQSVYIEKGGQRAFKSPKTASSVRDVAIPPSLMEEIKKLIQINNYRKSMMGSLWKDSPSLIKSAYGDYMYPNLIYTWLTKFEKEHDLPHLGVHGLRHTYASMLVDLNIDIKTISSQLGHSGTVVTDRYIHQFEKKSTDVANKIDKIFANLLPNGGTESKEC